MMDRYEKGRKPAYQWSRRQRCWNLNVRCRVRRSCSVLFREHDREHARGFGVVERWGCGRREVHRSRLPDATTVRRSSYRRGGISMKTFSILGGLAGPPSACSSAPDRIDVFAVGPGDTVWRWSGDGANWSPSAPLPSNGSISAEGVCAVSSGPGGVEVFAVDRSQNPRWWRGNGTAWRVGEPPLSRVLRRYPQCRSPPSPRHLTRSTSSR